MKGFTRLPGVAIKFRTEERDGRRTATATLWVAEEKLTEIATLDLELVARPGDPVYQGWIDLISEAFNGYLARKTGEDVFIAKRRAADYRGE